MLDKFNENGIIKIAQETTKVVPQKPNKQDLINFEKNLASKWEAGEIRCPLHLCGGNEDELIEIFKDIKPNDYVFSSHRNHYHALLHGISPEVLQEEILGRSDALCCGRARSMGFISHAKHFYASAIVGGCCAIAVGVAWGLKECNKDNYFCDEDQESLNRRVWCFVGDGVIDGGHFWEALQYAEGYKLPITFIIEDNNRATCSIIKDRCGINSELREIVKEHPNVRWYYYIPSWPHVGIGKYVQF